jgi:hypothetical protein
MNPKVKSFLIICLKQAIIGASTTVATVWADPEKFNLTSVKGWEDVLLVVGAAILTREGLVWGPKLLAWANSPTNGN